MKYRYFIFIARCFGLNIVVWIILLYQRRTLVRPFCCVILGIRYQLVGAALHVFTPASESRSPDSQRLNELASGSVSVVARM